MNKYTSLAALAAFATPALVFAQDAVLPETVASAAPWGLMFAFFGAGMATFLACIGSVLGVSMVGQAGSGLISEKPDLAGKVITLAVLPGSQGLYGMVISLLFIFNFGPVISGEVPLSMAQGLILLATFLPVAVTCFTSAPYQAKVCTAGLHMLAKDGRLAGRVITLAALVETYALLGFLISFFLLNSFRGSILG